jgi:hypothetical protein
MIAVSLFVVIVMAGMGALLNANLLHQKSRDMRSIIDNLSFVMEEMSRNIRTGTAYHCIDDVAGDPTATTPHSCVSGAGISFKSSLDGSQWVYAIFNDGTIQKSILGGTTGTFTTLTLPEVTLNISSSSFSVVGAEPPSASPSDSQQPLVTIRLIGHITTNGVISPFSLQTSVSQRQIDI